METEIKTIERLIKQGSSDEELFEKYPKHIDRIKSYREFLIQQSKPYEAEVIECLSSLPFKCYFGKDRDGVLEIRIPIRE